MACSLVCDVILISMLHLRVPMEQASQNKVADGVYVPAQAEGTGAQHAARRGVRDWLLRRPHPPPVQRQRAVLDAEARADAAASAGNGLMVRVLGMMVLKLE